MEIRSLYDRLGQARGISLLVEDILDAHMRNDVIKARFLPFKEQPERLAEAKRHLCGFLCAGSGGTEEYAGRSMPEAHRGMNISEAEYMAALDDILETLKSRELDEQTQKDVLAIAYSLKGEIMHL